MLASADKLDAALAVNSAGSVTDLAAAVREVLNAPPPDAGRPINWLMWSFVGLAVLWNPLIIGGGMRVINIVCDAWDRALRAAEARAARERSQFSPRPPDLDKKDSKIAEFARASERQAHE